MKYPFAFLFAASLVACQSDPSMEDASQKINNDLLNQEIQKYIVRNKEGAPGLAVVQLIAQEKTYTEAYISKIYTTSFLRKHPPCYSSLYLNTPVLIYQDNCPKKAMEVKGLYAYLENDEITKPRVIDENGDIVLHLKGFYHPECLHILIKGDALFTEYVNVNRIPLFKGN